MTHEYDDPIKPEALLEAARAAAGRHRIEERPLDHIVLEIVHERFCSCVASPESGDNASILDALTAEVAERARDLLKDEKPLDRVDRASIDSFPASDPPSWIAGGPEDER